jgi:hypothetical protein
MLQMRKKPPTIGLFLWLFQFQDFILDLKSELHLVFARILPNRDLLYEEGGLLLQNAARRLLPPEYLKTNSVLVVLIAASQLCCLPVNYARGLIHLQEKIPIKVIHCMGFIGSVLR